MKFEGLTRTKESYLRSLITCKEGLEVDSIILQKDVDFLKNLNLFFDVNGYIKETEFGANVVFEIHEATYLYPVIWMSGFKDQLKVILGVNHINFLGRAQEIGFTYQYYDRHSFYLFWKANRHSNKFTGHEFALEKYSTIEPLYFEDTVSYFDFDNYSVLLGGHYWITPYLKAGLGGKYMYENYAQRDEAFPLAGDSFKFNKYQIHTGFTFNNVRTTYERQQGINAAVYGEYIHTENYPMASFLKFISKITYYREFYKRGNIALRGQFGVSTNNDSPFAPFVLDGILNVRGIGNRVERGTAELILNAEYRCTFLRHKWFSFQSVLFADYGALREPGKKFDTFFDNGETNLFLGGGLRFNLNVWYKTSLRVDYSFNPTNTSLHGVTFGIGQFF
ncbi:MAG: hypothetical protein QNK23_15655 [Crocinitomicaceae bacterium]|nr:hypothetical protein [Crocinitomicaceae bacterium]